MPLEMQIFWWKTKNHSRKGNIVVVSLKWRGVLDAPIRKLPQNIGICVYPTFYFDGESLWRKGVKKKQASELVSKADSENVYLCLTYTFAFGLLPIQFPRYRISVVWALNRIDNATFFLSHVALLILLTRFPNYRLYTEWRFFSTLKWWINSVFFFKLWRMSVWELIFVFVIHFVSLVIF